MNKGIVVGIIILFLGIVAAPLTESTVIEKSNPPISNGKTLYVGGTGEGNYTIIQDAIDNSSDGDTIFVYAYSSPYYEHVKVNKSINLIGEDRETTVIDGSRSGYAINIWRADKVYINGFTIQNCDSGSDWYYAGIKIYNSDSNTITGNIISNNRCGISLYYSDGNTITGNNIYSNNRSGIIFDYSHGNIFTGNIISNNDKGVYIIESWDNIIQKNNLLNNKNDSSFRYHFVQILKLKRNRWRQNYWNRPRILPKLIHGLMTIPLLYFAIFIPWINIDWRPALLPYKIEV